MQNLLFICSRNQWRSPTAEAIWRKHPDFNVKSAGTSPRARKTVNASDIRWADVIFVMEQKHKDRLKECYTISPFMCCIFPMSTSIWTLDWFKSWKQLSDPTWSEFARHRWHQEITYPSIIPDGRCVYLGCRTCVVLSNGWMCHR